MQQESGPVFKSKNDLTRDDLVDLFQTLADKAQDGGLTLSSGAGQVEIALPDGCRVEIEVTDKVERDGIERELELEISWRVDETGAPLEGQLPKRGFTIS